MSGRLQHTAANIIAKLIVDMGLGGAHDAEGNDSWNTFHSEDVTKPDKAIFVHDSEPVLQGRIQVSGQYQERYGFIILVRGDDSQVTGNKINEIMSAFAESVYEEEVKPEDDDPNVYLVHSISRASGPFSIGKEQNGERWFHSLNCLATIKDVTP